ncbi:MAG: hypothetical protein HYT40_03625 [Candidatus Sungbacteria bacterium]|uniref:Uncharacterized protein n=1 Tax=Candidatus Sungiibacteriota bacterium TaxID=2750080 RepID=A0A931SDX8_9BACT|nr:hypothetical protein [Candidatus Sungbacteria bacterium]
MKKIIIFILIVAAIYFGWKYAPQGIKDKIYGAASYIGLPNISRTSILKPLAPLKDKLAPQDPVLTRAVLIDELAENLDTITENKSPKTAAEKAALESAIQSSNDLIKQLREENPKSSLTGQTLKRVMDAVLPDNAPVCTPANP